MDDDGFLTLLQIGLIIAAVLIIAAILVGGWKMTCPQTTTACDCNGDYPKQCNYQCYHAPKCTCDDLDDLKNVRNNLKSWVAKKKAQVGVTPRSTGSASGDIPGVPITAPDNDRSGSPSGTGSDASAPESPGSPDWHAGGELGGITPGGEIWIDESAMDDHCQYVADSLSLHETVHLGDQGCRNPWAFFAENVQKMFDRNYINNQQDKSELSAYQAQIAFLNDKIASLQATCSHVYTCSYSGTTFDDVQDCIATCPCSLAHPCAGFGHCIEYNSETGEKTGMKY